MLQYNLKNKNTLKHREWFEKLRAQGKNVPTFDDAPVLLVSGVWLWDAFNMLAGHRLHNEIGPQPITLVEVAAYSDITGCDTAEAELLMHVVMALDMLFLTEHYRKKPG